MSKAGEKILKGLEDAVAFARGDETRGKVTVVKVPRHAVLTSAAVGKVAPAPTPTEMLRIIDEAMTKVLIGHWAGSPVFLDCRSGLITIRQGDSMSVTFSLDHPYVQGTKIERAAREVMKGASGTLKALVQQGETVDSQ